MAVQWEPATILIAEDDPHIGAVLADLLADEGYRVAVSVGEAALARALAEPPALVLLDLLMPGMDGAEVCRRLNADPRTRAVPVVVTATPPDVVRGHLADCRYAGLIRKPFALHDILDAVARHLAA